MAGNLADVEAADVTAGEDTIDKEGRRIILKTMRIITPVASIRLTPPNQLITINAGTSIIDVINLVLRNSNYVIDQLEPGGSGPINWFKIIPKVELKEFDKIRKVYQKKITYSIIKSTYHNSEYFEIQWTYSKFKKQGYEVDSVDFPYIDQMLPTYYVLTTAEASSNLSRFDGVKYGYRTPQAQNLEQLYKNSRSEGFGEEVKRRIMLGTFVLSASYYDAYYH